MRRNYEREHVLRSRKRLDLKGLEVKVGKTQVNVIGEETGFVEESYKCTQYVHEWCLNESSLHARSQCVDNGTKEKLVQNFIFIRSHVCS